MAGATTEGLLRLRVEHSKVFNGIYSCMGEDVTNKVARDTKSYRVF